LVSNEYGIASLTTWYINLGPGEEASTFKKGDGHVVDLRARLFRTNTSQAI
jgi:hypothetical protein